VVKRKRNSAVVLWKCIGYAHDQLLTYNKQFGSHVNFSFVHFLY